MFTEYNPNPAGRRVGDCAVRADEASRRDIQRLAEKMEQM